MVQFCVPLSPADPTPCLAVRLCNSESAGAIPILRYPLAQFRPCISVLRGAKGPTPYPLPAVYASTSTPEMNLSFLQGRLVGQILHPTDNVASRSIPIVFRSTRSFQIRIESCLPEPSQRKTPDVSGIPQSD